MNGLSAVMRRIELGVCRYSINPLKTAKNLAAQSFLLIDFIHRSTAWNKNGRVASTPIIMKFTVIALIALVGVSLSGANASAVPAAKESKVSNVEIVFDHPDKFTDIKDSSMNTEKGQASIMADLREFIETKASGLLAANQKFKITFTDIDLAGDYEPWRMPPGSDIRIVKDIYPPRFDFSWQLTDASGTVLKEGQEKLRDFGFMSRLVIDRSDALRYEKDMLQDWLRSHLPGKAK